MYNLSAKIHTSIDNIDPMLWRSLFGPQLLRRYGYYKTMQDSRLTKFKFYYIQILKDNQTIAIAPCFVMDFPIDFSLEKRYKRITTFISKIFYYLINIRTVFIGMPMSCQCDIAVSSQIQDRTEIFEKVLEVMRNIAKKENAWMIAFKDFPCQFGPYLETKNFIEIETYPNARLNINFDSFEGYLKTLSYATRYDFRRKIRIYATLKPLTLEIRKNFDGCLDRIYQLYMNTVKKNELHFDTVKKDYFSNMVKNMQDEILIFIWKLDDKIVGFNLCFRNADTMVGDFIGFDYDVVYKYNLYFIAVKDKIEWCIKNNIKTLDEGTFTLELKKHLKFNFYKNYFYMKPSFSIFDSLAKAIIPFFRPSEQDKQILFLKKFKKI